MIRAGFDGRPSPISPLSPVKDDSFNNLTIQGQGLYPGEITKRYNKLYLFVIFCSPLTPSTLARFLL
jgi:hypothetical protein